MSAQTEEIRYESPWGINAVWILKSMTKEILPVYEQVAKLATQKLAVSQKELFDDDYQRNHELAAVLRTGGLFVFDSDDLPAIGEMEHSRELLPPLPFPRMWVEIEGIPWFTIDSDNTQNIVFGWAITEVEQGLDWNVKMMMADLSLLSQAYGEGWLTNLTQVPFMCTAIREYNLLFSDEHQKIVVTYGENDRTAMMLLQADPDPMKKRLYDLTAFMPEYLVQLTHVLGAEQDQRSFPRPVRRDFTRATGLSFPQLYFVGLRGAGESHPGSGETKYRHRWLVRGHYRKQENGEFVISGKGTCTWVRPYIKGPAGAPWKGRSVYRSGRDDDD